MLRRLYLITMLLTLPAVLTGCPGEDDTVGEEMEEGMEEVGDEIDDAL